MSFTQSVYHIVFSTKKRIPSINIDKERIAIRYYMI